MTGPFANIWRFFTRAEREILLAATPDDMLAPSDALGARVPEKLRARFLAIVIKLTNRQK
jgi:hypothetical protein